MDQKALVSEICDQADMFLAGVTALKEARAGISEWLTIHHPSLTPELKKSVVADAIQILKNEGFFETEAGLDS